MNIPFFDYRPWYRKHELELRSAIDTVLASGQVILGPQVLAFEQEFAAYCQCSEAVGVNSGTDALIVALRALDVGPGHEVITVANAGVPPVAAICAVGAVPAFVDVLPSSLLLDPAALEPARNERTRCILVVHLYGQPVELDPVLDFASEHGLHVVEDCAHAHGATYHDRPVGTFGDAGCFSFYPTKVLGAFGDAGLCITDDRRLARRMRMIRTYGYADSAEAQVEGINSRLDELQAAILRVKLTHLNEAIRQRRRLVGQYRDALRETAYGHPQLTAGGSHVYHLFVVTTPRRSQVTEMLRRERIGFGLHYPHPVHLMPAYRSLGYRSGQLPATEAACGSVISLPLFDGLDAGVVEVVADVLRSQG